MECLDLSLLYVPTFLSLFLEPKLTWQPGQTRPNQPMTYLDQKRAQAQKMYEEEQKYWRDNAEEFKKYVFTITGWDSTDK